VKVSRPVTFALATALLSAVAVRATAPQKTTQDKVYTKAQAARGEKQYTTVCATCHDPAKVPAGKKPAPELVGEKFLSTWDGRTLGELQDQILTTMPNDGSVVLTEDQTADLVAYILQSNKQPDGAADLKYGASSKDIVIKK
jgi:mono/diheme cytochrome c family protein